MFDFTPHFPQDLENYAPWVAKYGLAAPYGECQCGCGKRASTSRESRRSRAIRKGEPQRYIHGHKKGDFFGRRNPRASLKDILLLDTDVGAEDDCWLWRGGNLLKGYGRIHFGGKWHRAHRVSYEVFRGLIPDGMFVCHRCDVRNCVNPDHLFIGTAKENSRDMVEKGRSGNMRGENAHLAKLTERKVRYIRKMVARGASSSELANKFGVTQQTIHFVVTRRSWKHVE